MNRRRVLLKLGLFVLAGAIVNVVVAWGFAIGVAARAGTPHIRSAIINQPWDGPGTENWQMRRYERLGRMWISSYKQRSSTWDPDNRGLTLMKRAQQRAWGRDGPVVDESLIPAWSLHADGIEADDSWMVRTRNIAASGWPQLALWSERAAVAQSLGAQQLTLFGGLDTGFTPHSSAEARDLPLRPLWPGFAINTIFYAAILWLLLAGPGAMRRSLRRRRGQCPACAYPVGASETCTECGQPLAGQAIKQFV